jgi:hypothetical protein
VIVAKELLSFCVVLKILEFPDSPPCVSAPMGSLYWPVRVLCLRRRVSRIRNGIGYELCVRTFFKNYIGALPWLVINQPPLIVTSLSTTMRSLFGLLDQLSDANRMEQAKKGATLLDDIMVQMKRRLDLMNVNIKRGAGFSTQISDLETKTRELEKQVDDFGQGILENERKQKEVFAVVHEFYSFPSYLLFAIG